MAPAYARCETLKPNGMFRAAYRSRRCVVPVDGYFERRAVMGRKVKQPYAIAMRNDQLFCLAGIWDVRTVPGGAGEPALKQRIFAIVTCSPNSLAATSYAVYAVHDGKAAHRPARRIGPWNAMDDPRQGAAAERNAPVPFTKLKAKRTFEEVVARVREMLFDGALKPGDRLPGERDLAVQLGIGRPALREALRALESSGLIILRKGKTGGAFISHGNASVIAENMSDLLRLSRISVDQFYEVRLWIQTGLARAACQRATPRAAVSRSQPVSRCVGRRTRCRRPSCACRR